MKRVLLLVLLCTPLLAGDFDRHEKKWTEQCLAGLASKSANVRASASRALGMLGVDVLPIVVKRCTALKTDEAWKALASALDAMGKTEAATKLESLRESWPSSAKKRLADLVQHLNLRMGAGDPKIAAQVRKLLAKFDNTNSYSSEEKEVKEVIRIGRPAVPALLEMLRDPTMRKFGFLQTAICDALAGLAEEEDRAALTDFVLSGKLEVSKCFVRIRGEKTLDAFIAALNKGLCDHDLIDALRHYAGSKRMVTALIQYMQRHGKAGFTAGSVAEFLGEIRAYDAVPVLEALLPARGEEQYKRGIGTGLSLLGSKKGIPVLLDVFGSTASRDGWQRHRAGETLNTIVGTRVYTGSFGGESRDARGNFAEAGATFRSWWKKNQANVVFSRETGRWSVG